MSSAAIAATIRIEKLSYLQPAHFTRLIDLPIFAAPRHRRLEFSPSPSNQFD
jgi:hypothetical protein